MQLIYAPFAVLVLSFFSIATNAKPTPKDCAADPFLVDVARAQQLTHGRFCVEIDRAPISPKSPYFKQIKELKLACACIEDGYGPHSLSSTMSPTSTPTPTSTSTSSTPTPTSEVCVNDSTITVGGGSIRSYDYKVECSFGPSNYNNSLVAVFPNMSNLTACTNECFNSFIDTEMIAAVSFFSDMALVPKNSPYPPGNCACYQDVDMQRDGFVKMNGVDSSFLTPDPY